MKAEESATYIVACGKLLYERGYIVAGDGNISIRLEGGSILTTPAGLNKGSLKEEWLVRVSTSGEKLEGEKEPSSELKMHLAAYKARPDINAVVHAHPPIATAFACSNRQLNKALVAELVLTLGTIPTAPFGTPSTDEVPNSLKDYIIDHDGMLLANHGVLALGTDLVAAFNNMETIEHFAKISMYSQIIGDERPLNKQQLASLLAVMEEKGISNPAVQAGRLPLTLENLEKEQDV